jgi:hypothetical protein
LQSSLRSKEHLTNPIPATGWIHDIPIDCKRFPKGHSHPRATLRFSNGIPHQRTRLYQAPSKPEKYMQASSQAQLSTSQDSRSTEAWLRARTRSNQFGVHGSVFCILYSDFLFE